MLVCGKFCPHPCPALRSAHTNHLAHARLVQSEMLITPLVSYAGDEQSGKWHRREQSFGTVSRTLRLPAGVDADAISGGVADGVLTMHMPKVQGGTPGPRKVQLQ